MDKSGMSRRSFFKGAAAAGLAGGVATGGYRMAQAQDTEKTAESEDTRFEPLINSVQTRMLPKGLSAAEQVELAKACGFKGFEASPYKDLDAAKEFGKLAKDAGVPVHSITYGGWQALFSDPDPEVVKKGHEGMQQALRTAHAMGADTVLLVPAKVTAEVRYVEAYRRSQDEIPKLFSLAEELGVVIAVENVWNNFLLSPLEFARYVDEFDSPWLQAYFDVGNVVVYGWPQDWIRTLAHRIRRVHYKDFKKDTREWTPLYEGSVDWPEVRQAFHEIGYDGYATCELADGDKAYLTEVAHRMTRIGKGHATAS